MKLRRLTSLSLFLSFIIMSFTGIVLFIVPQGRVAYWSNWKLLGLTKTQYGNIHTTFMVLFLVFGVLHIYLNWKPIVAYLKNKNKKISFTKKDVVVAVVLNVLFLIGSIYTIQPFKAYLDFENNIKGHWTKLYGEPPYGHAEESSLKSFCKKLDINLQTAINKLQKHGIKITDEAETLKEIAKNNNKTPKEIYDIIKTDNNIIISSLGRKTLKELCAIVQIDLRKSIEKLKNNGAKNVDQDTTIKSIAEQLNKTPQDVYKLLTKK